MGGYNEVGVTRDVFALGGLLYGYDVLFGFVNFNASRYVWVSVCVYMKLIIW